MATIKKHFRKNVYRWHRITGLVVVLPVFLWTLSGLLHPVMNYVKPEVRNKPLTSLAIDARQVRMKLDEVLQLHGIRQLEQFRIIQLKEHFYYQVKLPQCDTLSYFSCTNGTWLHNGDALYAGWLAEQYLARPVKQSKDDRSHYNVSGRLAEQKSTRSEKEKPAIAGLKFVPGFTSEYRPSQVLLPVFRVSFERTDGLRLYIHTASGRLSAAIDNKRGHYIRFFSLAHTWSFLNSLGPTRHLVIGIFSLLCMITSLLGFFVYNIINTKKKNKAIARSRRYHRLMGNLFVLTTALYGFSGAWHSFHKLSVEDKRKNISINQLLESSDMDFSLHNFSQFGGTLTNVSAIRMQEKIYWQLQFSDAQNSTLRYVQKETGRELKDGDYRYGVYLAGMFAGNDSSFLSVRKITAFDHHYSMKHKKLPVMEVALTSGQCYYIETSSGSLATVRQPGDAAERFSFSNLHMHHYWEQLLGKSAGTAFRDMVLVSSTLGLMALALTGWLIRKRRSIHDNR